MFDLELSIQQWKEEFSGADSFRNEDVLELESHLRELMAKLRGGELSDQEAFLIATRRLGEPVELSKEFGKVHRTAAWRKRILWMLGGYFLVRTSAVWIGTLSSFTVAGLGAIGTDEHTMIAASLGVSVVLWAALLKLALYKSKNQNAGADRLPLSWVCAGGIVLYLGLALSVVGSHLQKQYLVLDEPGTVFYWQAIGFTAIKVCVLIAMFVLIAKLNEPKPKTTGMVS